jgi:stage V sporulation protein S
MLKVSSKSNPSALAGAIVAVLKDNKHVELNTIGAGALNQAVKAIAIARGFIAPTGQDLSCTPAFADVIIDGGEKTAIKFTVTKKQMVVM